MSNVGVTMDRVMHSWRFNTAVMLLWLAAMTWLVKEKVLPPLTVGEPPNYSRIIESHGASPSGWNILVNRHCIGWAQRHPAATDRPGGDS